MPSPSGPDWMRGPAARRPGTVNPQLRVSDAERAQVADRLSEHYGDGRLDQDEFSERLNKAMSAKTQADLGGLLDDLPAEQHPVQEAGQRHRRPYRLLLFLFVTIALVALAGHLSAALILPFPWLLIGLLAFLLLRRRGSRAGRGGPDR